MNKALPHLLPFRLNLCLISPVLTWEDLGKDAPLMTELALDLGNTFAD